MYSAHFVRFLHLFLGFLQLSSLCITILLHRVWRIALLVIFGLNNPDFIDFSLKIPKYGNIVLNG